MSRRVILIIVLVLFSNTSFSQVKNESELLSHLRTMGMTVVKAHPIDFQLDSVNSKHTALSDFKGKWIMLTFWATWCGPCKYEMPHLEMLLASLSSAQRDQLSVVGLSIDRGDVKEVKKFLKKYDVSFPNFHDKQNQVASAYKSSSVPSIYLISPDWKLVGIMRGAKNWSSKDNTKLVEKLLTFKDAKEVDLSGVEPSEVLNEQVVPVEITPPELMSSIDFDQSNNKGFLNISVSWNGNAYLYEFKTPVVGVTDSVELGMPSSRSSSKVNGGKLIYQFPFQVSQVFEGEIEFDPIEMEFKARQNGEWQFTRSNSVKLKILKEGKYLWWALTISMLILALVTLIIKLKRRGITAVIDDSLQTQYLQQFEDLLAKKMQLKGGDFQIQLLKFYDILTNEVTEKNKLKSAIEKISYSGEMLTTPEENYYIKLIKKKLDISEDN